MLGDKKLPLRPIRVLRAGVIAMPALNSAWYEGPKKPEFI